MRDPGLPYNLGIIPSVPIIKVTSSRTKLHLAATRALAAREDVKSFGLSLPSPTTDLELMELMTWTAPRLTCLEIQQVLPCHTRQLHLLEHTSHAGSLSARAGHDRDSLKAIGLAFGWLIGRGSASALSRGSLWPDVHCRSSDEGQRQQR